MDVAPGDRVGGGFGRAGLTVGPGDPKGLCQPKQFHHSTFGFHQHCSRSCLVVTHMAAVLKQLSLSFSPQKEINSDIFFFLYIPLFSSPFAQEYQTILFSETRHTNLLQGFY